MERPWDRRSPLRGKTRRPKLVKTKEQAANMTPTATQLRALEFLHGQAPQGVRASQIGMAVTGGMKANGTHLRPQGAGFIGAKILAGLRKNGWAENRLSRDRKSIYAHITAAGIQALTTTR